MSLLQGKICYLRSKLCRAPPFGYEGPENEDLEQKILKGLNKEILGKVEDVDLRDLIEKLMQKDIKKRLGSERGFEEI